MLCYDILCYIILYYIILYYIVLHSISLDRGRRPRREGPATITITRIATITITRIATITINRIATITINIIAINRYDGAQAQLVECRTKLLDAHGTLYEAWLEA